MKVRYTLPALADLSAILDYIDLHSQQGAKRVQACIRSVIDLLLIQPLIGTRHAVRHGARDPSGMPGSE